MHDGKSPEPPVERIKELEMVVRQQRAQLNERRKRTRGRRSEFAFQVAAQALGTTLGAGIVALIAIALGILRNVPLASVLVVLGAVVLVIGSLTASFWGYRSLQPISDEHAEYMELLRKERHRELGEKLARGEELTKDDHQQLTYLVMFEAGKRSKKPRS